MLIWLQTSLMLLQGLLALMVAYLLLLTAAAWRAVQRTPLRPAPATRFLILIPAYNEEQLLPQTLACLHRLAYPSHLYTVHVVADNCTDNTAVLAREAGAMVHERFNEKLRGKGYALQWLLERLWQANEPHDAVVILDADTTMSADFLQVMDARLARGERAIQSYYAVRAPQSSWSVGLRYAAFAVIHYLRPLGRMVLGGSAGLKGNGMVFATDILRSHRWSASVTEDIEFHMALLLDGERVTFAPDAVVWGEMPQHLTDAETQNVRWEQGRLQLARRYVPPLLQDVGKAWRRGDTGRSFRAFDAIMEHLIPPFSVLVGLSGLSLLVAFLLPPLPWKRPLGQSQRTERPAKLKKVSLLLNAGILCGQIIYLLSGLRLVRAPKLVYKSLIYAPVFILWKIWHYLLIVFSRDEQGWVRTVRNGE